LSRIYVIHGTSTYYQVVYITMYGDFSLKKKFLSLHEAIYTQWPTEISISLKLIQLYDIELGLY